MPKPGFKVISIREAVYDGIKTLAESKGKTIAALIEDMYKVYTSPSIAIGENGVARPIETKWPWPGPYVSVVTSPKVKHYRSTAWIINEEYPEKIGTPQMDPKIMDRIRKEEDFSVEKIIVVSPKAWDKVAVWKWIFEWFSISFVYGERVKVFVVDEKKVSKNNEIDKRFFDMGIYGDELVGFLELNEDWDHIPTEQLEYSWIYDRRRIKEAQDKFERLKRFAADRSLIIEQFSKFLGHT
jgi:hypothetical protein